MAEKKKKSPNESGPQEKSPSLLEWLFAAIGVLVVTSALGFLIYRGATKRDTPPAIKIEVESVTQTGGTYLVSFRVFNSGDTTAADLTIEGELKNGEKPEETSDVTMTYVPAQSVRRGGLFFTKNPSDFQLNIRAKGYEQP
jgi:uncharacterized protein (TIGR02588 family)